MGVTKPAEETARTHVGRGCALAATIGLVLIGGCGLAAHLYDRHWEKKVEAKLAEYRAAGQPVTWAEVLAARQSIPDEENSALIFLEAFKQMAPADELSNGPVFDAYAGVRTGGARHSEQLRSIVKAYLDANGAALDKIREAAVLLRGDYPRDDGGYFVWVDPAYTGGVRDAVRLCDAAAIYHAEQREPEQAARSLVQARRAVASVGEVADLAEANMRTDTGWSWVEGVQQTLALCHMSIDQLRTVRAEMAREDAELSLHLALRGTRSYAQRYFNHVGGRKAGWKNEEDLLLHLYRFLPARSHKDAFFCYDVFDRAADISRLSLRERGSAAERVAAEVHEKTESALFRNLFLAAFPHDMWLFFERGEVMVHTALRVGCAALAVEEWRLAHGRWPDSLDALVPDFLDEVPDDPFCENKIRYRRTVDGVVVYSIGPNGRDDGGRTRMFQSIGFLINPDIPFRLLDPELRGARTLTFYEELLDSEWAEPFLGELGYTKDDARALGLSEEQIRELRSRYPGLAWW